mmetsp:Transcript_66920/g.195673  ORF Transcript_66920/g.195673 Transcript_66920/m.195673 type:complete len:278 (+) Transcript_66920:115-948(+)
MEPDGAPLALPPQAGCLAIGRTLVSLEGQPLLRSNGEAGAFGLRCPQKLAWYRFPHSAMRIGNTRGKANAAVCQVVDANVLAQQDLPQDPDHADAARHVERLEVRAAARQRLPHVVLGCQGQNEWSIITLQLKLHNGQGCKSGAVLTHIKLRLDLLHKSLRPEDLPGAGVDRGEAGPRGAAGAAGASDDRLVANAHRQQTHQPVANGLGIRCQGGPRHLARGNAEHGQLRRILRKDHLPDAGAPLAQVAQAGGKHAQSGLAQQLPASVGGYCGCIRW